MAPLFAALALLLAGCAPDRDIHYIPFESADVGPVDADSIEEKAPHRWKNAPEGVRVGLLEVYDCETKRSFDARAVRLKVHHNGDEVLVDANGVTKRPGSTCLANLPVLRAALRGLIEPEGRERIRSLLADAMGPSGWYRGNLVELESRGRRFRWTGVATKVLEEVGGRPVLELGIYTKAFPANPGHVAVISERGEWNEDDRKVVVDVFDVGRLAPIEPKLENAGENEDHGPYRAGGEPVESLLIPDHLPEGMHRAPRSRYADRTEEVVFLAGGPGAPRDWKGSSPSFSVYAWRPHEGELRVFPQHWFLGDRFDAGYQWITQARRDPETGRLIGTGIRLWDFELDESGTGLRRVFLRGAEKL